MAGLSLCLLIGAGLLAWSVTQDDTYVAPTPHAAQPRVRPAVAAETLAAFQEAVQHRDVPEARDLAPHEDPATAAALAALVRNAKALRVSDFTLRYVDDDGTPTSDGLWDAAVDATWRFRGFDDVAARAEITVHLVNDGDRVALTGFGGRSRVSPIWLSGPLQVRRTPSTLVMVAGTPAQADSYAARATTAVPVVRRVLPRWHSGLVIEVPASVGDLERALDADTGTYDQIAAVTTSADGSAAPDSPVHIFANPDVFGTLRPTGAQVVMSHEATHVATGAWDAQMPLWLLEGFADYVALRDIDLPVSRSAAQIIAEVRKHGPPRHLPGASDFDTRTPNLGATYESAWLICRLLAQRGGEQALVSFYRSVDAGRSVPTALAASFGMSVPELTEAWQNLLSGLAG